MEKSLYVGECEVVWISGLEKAASSNIRGKRPIQNKRFERQCTSNIIITHKSVYELETGLFLLKTG